MNIERMILLDPHHITSQKGGLLLVDDEVSTEIEG